MLELRILTGLHRGAAFPLDGEAVCIGGGAANDVVLTDPGMPERALEITRGKGGEWTIARIGLNPGGTEIVAAGMRVPAGPVLVGFADERQPWQDNAAFLASEPQPFARRDRQVSLIALAVAVALGAAALFVLVFDATFVNDRPAPESEHLPSVRQGESKGASDETLQRQPTVRRIEAVVHPAREEPAAPPFGVQSVRGGKDGFVVMDDGRVLVPGNAWRELTLERIEPRRILFSGRYPAELPW